MTAQKPQELPAYAGQIQELDREPKAQNRKLPAFAAVFLLLAGIVLPVFLGKNFDFPDSRTRADLGILLVVLREIRVYRKDKRLAAQFYGEMLPMLRGTEPLPRYSLTLLKTGIFHRPLLIYASDGSRTV